MKTRLSSELSKIINKFLQQFNLRIVRSSSWMRLVMKADRYKEITEASESEMFSLTQVTNLEARITALESHSYDQSIKNIISYAIKAHWRTIDIIDSPSGFDKPTTCPLCGYEANQDAFKEIVSHCIFQGGRLLRHVCPSCEVIFGPQKMLCLDDEMLDLEYRNLYRIYSEGNTTSSVIRTFHLLEPKKNGVYLDFGCGGEWSDAIQLLREEGWNIYGFEPSANQSSKYVFSRWEEVEMHKFDGILSHNVLEHLFDPVGTTRRLSQLLSSSGRIVHATPCFEYQYEFTRFHVFFFTGKSPNILAKLSGMCIEDWVRDGEYIACILHKVK